MANTSAFSSRLSFRPQFLDCQVNWNPSERFWCYFGDVPNKRYWCPFGIDDPTPGEKTLRITVEINSPLEGVDARVAGAFARSTSGRIYVVHNGAMGGGKSGISRSGFIRFCEHDDQLSHRINEVQWVRHSRTFVIGGLEDPDLPGRVGEFVRAVARYKGTYR
jgi:hypothetical protein